MHAHLESVQASPARGTPSRRAGFLALSILLGTASTAPAQDVLTIGGRAAVAGATVTVPIYLRDVSGTPLGRDRASGQRIQGIAFQLAYSPANAVVSASIARAGITASLTPVHESTPTAAGSVSWIVAFAEASNLVPLTLNKSGHGDQVATLTLTLAPGLTNGTKVLLTPSSSASITSLANQGGSTLERSGSGLSVVSGMVSIGPFWGDANLDLQLDVFDLTILASYLVGNVAPGVAPFNGTAQAMNLDPALGANVDVFDLVLLAGAIVGNVPVLPVP